MASKFQIPVASTQCVQLTVSQGIVALDGRPCRVAVAAELQACASAPQPSIVELFCRSKLLREALSVAVVVVAPQKGTAGRYEIVAGVPEYELLLAVGQQHNVAVQAVVLAKPIRDCRAVRLWEMWARFLLSWSAIQSVKAENGTQDAASTS